MYLLSGRTALLQLLIYERTDNDNKNRFDIKKKNGFDIKGLRFHFTRRQKILSLSR